ncbi:MAG TPA: transposase [Acetobacteraceae bacterium]|jgi:transposase-like protein|nr:transposase [Acetobacteraceae bacterium]HUN41144.1 transposase [Acetobacteraceae bacterium]
MSDLESAKRKRRGFSREFKLTALARMNETRNIVGLAQELGLERKLLYCWRDKLQAGGPENLRGAGRPRGSCSADRDQLVDRPALETATEQQR